tara:strand:+ start:173 stop:1654 length:1482 start_codon:yes stop_codon:yes gene_type:complete
MKQIIKKFNNLIKKTIFIVENKTNNKFKISRTNKVLITFIGLLFLYIFYLLIPIIYEKDWVKNKIQTQLLSEFKMNLNFTEDISYRILPAPHFLIKNSKLALNSSKSDKPIAKIKNLKIFLDQMHFFNKEKMNIIEVIIDNANFSLLRSDLKLLNDSNNHKFSNKKIIINKSNIFVKDNLDEIITIIKINEANFFFNDRKSQNQFNLKGNIFAIPFTFDLITKNDLIIEKFFLFKAKKLNLDILNNHIVKRNSIIGNNTISFLNSSLDSEYEFTDRNIIFTSKNSKINNSKINYDGELSINPFDLDLNISINNYKTSKLFRLNSILIEFLKSELLFNENISLNTSITVNANRQSNFFHNAKIYINIINGNVNLDSSKFINDDIGVLKLNNSNLLFENNKLILSTNILFEIKNSDALFSFLNTNKKSRKEIKKILINLNYDFLSNQIEFNNIKIDNNDMNVQFFDIVDGFKDNNLNNLIKTRRLINELLKSYDG